MIPLLEEGRIETRLREVESRILEAIRTRDLAWREWASSAMLLVARMLVEIAPPRRRPQGERVMDLSLPIPDLEPRAINVEEFQAHTPEKFELIGGYLFDSADQPEARRRLLALLLVNVGLVEAVRLAPEARWREALRRALPAGQGP